MMSTLLIFAGQTLAAPPPVPAEPPKTAPSIYALVFVAKRPAGDGGPRKGQLLAEASRPRDRQLVLKPVLRMETVARLNVVKKQKDAFDALLWLQKSLRVDSLEDTGVLRISLADGSPQEQVVIVNAVAKTCFEVSSKMRRQDYESLIAHDSKECANAKQAIRVSELEIAKLDAMIAKDMNEAERIAMHRNTLTERIAFMKEKTEKCEAAIRERQEYLRKPPFILLELAELPPESK